MVQLAFIESIGASELLAIFLAVLVLFGPKSIPQLGRALGQALREFKLASAKMTEMVNSLDVSEPPPTSAPKPNYVPAQSVSMAPDPTPHVVVAEAEAPAAASEVSPFVKQPSAPEGSLPR